MYKIIMCRYPVCVCKSIEQVQKGVEKKESGVVLAWRELDEEPTCGAGVGVVINNSMRCIPGFAGTTAFVEESPSNNNVQTSHVRTYAAKCALQVTTQKEASLLTDVPSVSPSANTRKTRTPTI